MPNYEDSTIIVTMNDSLTRLLARKYKTIEAIMAVFLYIKLYGNGYSNVIPIDCGSFFLNKQHNIEEFLRNNLSVSEIRATQAASVDAARKNIFNGVFPDESFLKKFVEELGLPVDIKNDYSFSTRFDDVRISDAIKYGKQVGVVLSSIANDTMLQVWVDPISYLLDPKARKRLDVLVSMPKLLDNVSDGMERQMENLLGLNSDAKLLLMGNYVPRITSSQKFIDIISELNRKIEALANKYGQSYIDVTSVKSRFYEFHSGKEQFMKMQLMVLKELLQRLNKSEIEIPSIEVPSFDYSTRGLLGAQYDVKNLIECERQYVLSLVNQVIEISGYSEEEVRSFMQPFVEKRIQELRDHADVYKRSRKIASK